MSTPTKKDETISYLSTVSKGEYRDCDICQERYWGSFANRYLREVEIDGGDSFEYRCTSCLRKNQ